MPAFRSHCSDSPPPDGVYFAFSITNPSAKALIAVVSVWNVDEDAVYVPAATLEENWRKNASEVEVTEREPWAVQTVSAS